MFRVRLSIRAVIAQESQHTFTGIFQLDGNDRVSLNHYVFLPLLVRGENARLLHINKIKYQS